MKERTKNRLALACYLLTLGFVLSAALTMDYLAAAPWSIAAERAFGWLF